MQGKRPGRPKGKKDSVKRRKSGYILREARKRQNSDIQQGRFKGIDSYFVI